MLTEKQLTHYKNQLLHIKQEVLNVIEGNERSILEDDGELTSFDNHFADVASQTEDKEVQLSIKDRAQSILGEVEEALNRIKNGTYGKCVDTGEDIPIERLEALPYAKRTLEAEQKLQETTEVISETQLSFATPKSDRTGDERILTADELQGEHGNSSYIDK